MSTSSSASDPIYSIEGKRAKKLNEKKNVEIKEKKNKKTKETQQKTNEENITQSSEENIDINNIQENENNNIKEIKDIKYKKNKAGQRITKEMAYYDLTIGIGNLKKLIEHKIKDSDKYVITKIDKKTNENVERNISKGDGYKTFAVFIEELIKEVIEISLKDDENKEHDLNGKKLLNYNNIALKICKKKFYGDDFKNLENSFEEKFDYMTNSSINYLQYVLPFIKQFYDNIELTSKLKNFITHLVNASFNQIFDTVYNVMCYSKKSQMNSKSIMFTISILYPNFYEKIESKLEKTTRSQRMIEKEIEKKMSENSSEENTNSEKNTNGEAINNIETKTEISNNEMTIDVENKIEDQEPTEEEKARIIEKAKSIKTKKTKKTKSSK